MNTSDENLLFSFFAVSDFHIVEKRKNIGKRYRAWDYIQNTDCSFVLIAGDITNGCGHKEFEIAKNELELIASKIPVFIGYGNHDYIPNNRGAVASHQSRIEFSLWADNHIKNLGCPLERFGENGSYTSRIHNTQIIILDCASSYPSAIAGEQQLEWMDKVLSAADGDRFKIVMSHFPITDYVPSRTSKKQMVYVRDSMKQQRIFEKHKNILFFAGHTHFPLDSSVPAVLYDENNHVAYLNTASVGNALPCTNNAHAGKRANTSGSMGLYTEVYENYIKIYGVDFQNNRIIDECNFRLDM